MPIYARQALNMPKPDVIRKDSIMDARMMHLLSALDTFEIARAERAEQTAIHAIAEIKASTTTPVAMSLFTQGREHVIRNRPGRNLSSYLLSRVSA